MHVICKNCSAKIIVASKPSGHTTMSNVRTEGNVKVSGGKISFGPGGKLSFGSDGKVGFGPAVKSTFMCMSCGKSNEYENNEIVDD